MDPIAECAANTLARHPHPALRLGELLELMVDSVPVRLDASLLRVILERHPSLFRILDPGRGPWRDSLQARAEAYAADPWVLLATDPASDGAPHPTALRLRESVRWLGRGVDPRSALSVSRWYAIALAEREARRAIRRRAA